MHDEHGFNWLSFLGVDLHHYPSHVVMAVVVSLLLIVTTFIARGQLTRVMNSSTGGLIPEEKLTYRNFFEIVAESLYKLTESVIGHHDAPIYYPVIGTLFIFIFTANVF